MRSLHPLAPIEKRKKKENRKKKKRKRKPEKEKKKKKKKKEKTGRATHAAGNDDDGAGDAAADDDEGATAGSGFNWPHPQPALNPGRSLNCHLVVVEVCVIPELLSMYADRWISCMTRYNAILAYIGHTTPRFAPFFSSFALSLDSGFIQLPSPVGLKNKGRKKKKKKEKEGKKSKKSGERGGSTSNSTAPPKHSHNTTPLCY